MEVPYEQQNENSAFDEQEQILELWRVWTSSSLRVKIIAKFSTPLPSHVTLTQVRLRPVRGTPEQELVRVRNPHGDSAEWKGAWSDR